MKNKKKILLSSVMVIALCLSLIAGSTFALFTSESKVNVAVTSGKVEVVASLSTPTIYSAKASEDIATDSEAYAGTATAFGVTSKYEWEKQTETTYDDEHEVTYYVFKNTGTASIVGDTITLNRITPGDRVDFDVNITNNSNVKIQYRVIVTVNNGLQIFNAMYVYIDGIRLEGVNRTGNWKTLEANGAIPKIPVEIYLPVELDGEEYMNQSTSMTVSVEAVQSNAKTSNADYASLALTEATATKSVSVNKSETTGKIVIDNEPAVISDENNLITITLPTLTKIASSADVEDDKTSLTVKIDPKEEVASSVFTVSQVDEDVQEVQSYDVQVLLQNLTTNAITEDNTTEIIVQMYVGTGLSGVKLYHTHNDVTNEVTNATYDSETGYITFTTNNFSEYTVVYNKDYVYETVDENGKTEVVVLKASETPGVYVDPENSEKTVKVEKDGEGNVELQEFVEVFEYSVTYAGGKEKGFHDFAKALNAALSADGSALKLAADAVAPSKFIDVDKTLTIDLNGYEMTVGTGLTLNDSGVISVSGNLTLRDTSENAGTIKINQIQNGHVVHVENGGIFTLEGGCLKACQALQVVKGGIATIKGGTLRSEGYNNGPIYYAVNNKGEVAIEGGVFYSRSNNGIVNNSGKMTVTGGQFIKITSYGNDSYCTAIFNDGELVVNKELYKISANHNSDNKVTIGDNLKFTEIGASGELILGEGVSVGTLNISGGKPVLNNVTITSLTVSGGEPVFGDNVTIGNLTVNGSGKVAVGNDETINGIIRVSGGEIIFGDKVDSNYFNNKFYDANKLTITGGSIDFGNTEMEIKTLNIALTSLDLRYLTFKGKGTIENLSITRDYSTQWKGADITVESGVIIENITFTGKYHSQTGKSKLTLQGSGKVEKLTIKEYGDVTINDGVVDEKDIEKIDAATPAVENPIIVNYVEVSDDD
ncbi:MAG: SipW-dependent-type signal peptide-containing protein [Clostridia bacterium]|nr:SipW-dependent-type signal peptide-containing protein [Clostridia bacterium]